MFTAVQENRFSYCVIVGKKVGDRKEDRNVLQLFNWKERGIVRTFQTEMHFNGLREDNGEHTGGRPCLLRTDLTGNPQATNAEERYRFSCGRQMLRILQTPKTRKKEAKRTQSFTFTEDAS